MLRSVRPLLIGLIAGFPLLPATADEAGPARDRLFSTQLADPFSDPAPRFYDRFRELEDRFERLSQTNAEFARQNRDLRRQLDELKQPHAGRSAASHLELQNWEFAEPSTGVQSLSEEPDEPTFAPVDYRHFTDRDEPPVPHTAGGGSKTGGGDPTTTGRAQETGNRHRGNLSFKSHYDFDNDGFKFSTEDDEYSFGIRGMEQLDGRIYEQPAPGFASSGIYNPRTRIYFEGHLTKPIQYEFSFQQTFDSTNLLDAYVNFSYDPRLQLRVGRYKTPFTYEWYRIHIWDLLAPERSLFATNYEGQRRFGVMGWGTVFDNRMEYAVGSFNTQRNGYQPFNNLQDVMAFVNFKPFFNEDRGTFLRDLQFGGSVNAGHEDQPVSPAALRTNSAPSPSAFSDSGAANAATVPFLAFNPGVTENGGRALWELHAAWYYEGLTLLGAWQSGFESYATSGGPSRRISVDGWFIQAGYLITGETIRDRTLVDPLQPFDLRKGRFGIGALEPTARYSELRLDPRVFTEGLADPTRWTNDARLVDVGFNWYLNKFVKVYFDWERAMFASPVFSGNGPPQSSNDLFWIRTQVYF